MHFRNKLFFCGVSSWPRNWIVLCCVLLNSVVVFSTVLTPPPHRAQPPDKTSRRHLTFSGELSSRRWMPGERGPRSPDDCSQPALLPHAVIQTATYRIRQCKRESPPLTTLPYSRASLLPSSICSLINNELTRFLGTTYRRVLLPKATLIYFHPCHRQLKLSSG